MILIVSERLHSTMAALLGVAIILGVSLVGRPMRKDLFIFDFDWALEYVDFNSACNWVSSATLVESVGHFLPQEYR